MPGAQEMDPAAAPHRRAATTREVETARRLLWLIPTATLFLVVGYRLVTTSAWAEREVTRRVIEELTLRTRSRVRLGGVTLGWDLSPCFQHLELARARGAYEFQVTTRQACVERWASAVGSGFHAVRLRVDQPSIRVEPATEVGVEPKSGDATATSTRTAGRRAALREIEIVFDDLRLNWAALPLPERFTSGSFGPIDGAVTLQMRGGQTAATTHVREPTTGAVIDARVDPTSEGFDLSAGIEGDVVPIFRRFLEAAGLDIRKLPTRGRVGAIYSSKKRAATIDLDLEQHGVDLANDLVSAQRLVGFTAREKGRVALDLVAGTVRLPDAVVEVNGIPAILALELDAGAGAPKFEVRADLPTTPLLRLLRAVPGSRETVFTKDLSPSVLFALSFSLSGKLRDPATWQAKLDHHVSGIGPNGEGSGLEILNSTFRYYPLTKTGRSERPRIIGPASPSWQPYARIPYVQRRAVIVSEDSSFFFHKGIEVNEVQQAIGEGLSNGETTRGGSTITQQLVKNLFLTRDRTALRKLQEALLTFHLESTLTKEHIFELYMNIIEWGPNVYGLREAAEHYFGKKPENLGIREMVYLASIIPSPIPSHAHYESGFVPPKHNAKIEGMLERLHRLGNITDDQYETAKATVLRFARGRRPGEATPPAPRPEGGDLPEGDAE